MRANGGYAVVWRAAGLPWDDLPVVEWRYRAARQAGTPAVRYRKPEDWLDSLPESLREGATAEALVAVCALDLSELEGVEPPRGFGRD